MRPDSFISHHPFKTRGAALNQRSDGDSLCYKQLPSGGAGDSGRGWAERYLIKVRNVPAFMQKVAYEPTWDKAGGGGGIQKMLDDHVVKEKRQPRVFYDLPRKQVQRVHRTTGPRQPGAGKWSGPS